MSLPRRVLRLSIGVGMLGAGLGCRADSSGPAAPLQPMAAVIPAAGFTEVSVAPILIARDINDKGVVVGPLTPFPSSRGGVRYPDGRVINLGVLPGDDWSDAHGINNIGQVVGRSGNSSTAVTRGKHTNSTKTSDTK